jgi:hypothetical protein
LGEVKPVHRKLLPSQLFTTQELVDYSQLKNNISCFAGQICAATKHQYVSTNSQLLELLKLLGHARTKIDLEDPREQNFVNDQGMICET